MHRIVMSNLQTSDRASLHECTPTLKNRQCLPVSSLTILGRRHVIFWLSFSGKPMETIDEVAISLRGSIVTYLRRKGYRQCAEDVAQKIVCGIYGQPGTRRFV